MSKTIQEIAQEMTKGEFIKNVDDNEMCPSDFNLSNGDCNSGDDIEECHNCWFNAIKDIKFKDNPAGLFQTDVLPILAQLAESEAAYKELTEKRDSLKAQLLESMDKYNIEKWENDKFSITYVKGGTTTTIDSKKVKLLHPEVFEECSKTSSRKPSIRFKVKC